MQISGFSQSSSLINRPIYLWNLMVRSSANGGFFTETLQTYFYMRASGVHGNNFTFPLLLKACASLRSAYNGAMLHAHIIRIGFQTEIFVQTSLVDMYAKCSDLASSRQVFDEMSVRSVVSWNAMIDAYSRAFHVNKAFKLFQQMQEIRFEPNPSTFVSLLLGFAGPVYASLSQGLSLHGCIIKFRFHYDTPIANSLMQMYVNFGQIHAAGSLFHATSDKTVISWTIMLGGYLKAGAAAEVFRIFSQMRHNSVILDKVVFLDIISSCIQLGDLYLASSLHSLILKVGLHNEDPIDSQLISMYSKCGDLSSARAVFNMLSEKSVSSWTSVISGYANSGCPGEALRLFTMFTEKNIKPNGAILATAVSACADFGSLAMCKEMESYINLNNLGSDHPVSTSLIHMYCKCGSIDKAEGVFQSLTNRDLAAWSAMLNGYAVNGMGEEALHMFSEMQRMGIKPDASVYTSILLACSHSGLVEDGVKHFRSMQMDYGIEPTVEHYTCLVDTLSRAGHLELALNTIQEMPTQLQAQAWTPFLSACRTHCDIELGEAAKRSISGLNPRDSVNHVLMANLYTSVGKWKEAAEVRNLIGNQGLVKEPGYSQISKNAAFCDI